MLRAMTIQCCVFSVATVCAWVLVFAVEWSDTGIEARVLVLLSGIGALIGPFALSLWIALKKSLPRKSAIVYGASFSAISIVLWIIVTYVAIREAMTMVG
jgi:hypothetical protein